MVNVNNDINHFADDQNVSSSSTILIGTLLDSIPESLFLGVIIALNLSNLWGATITLFLGNFSSTIEGAKRMYEEGIRSETKRKKKINYPAMDVYLSNSFYCCAIRLLSC